MILFIFLSMVVSVLVLASWLNMLWDRSKTNIKGPFPWPIIGNADRFMRKETELLPALTQLANTYGDIYTIHLLSQRFVIVTHPKYVEPLLSSSKNNAKAKLYKNLEPWLGAGLLTSKGQRWAKHRKFLTPAFHFNILQSFFPVFLKNQRILQNKLNTLADGNPVDLFPIIALAALDNITETIMGVSMNAQDESQSKYVTAVHDASKIITMKIKNPLLQYDAVSSLFGYKKTLNNALEILHKQTYCVIESRQKALKERNIETLEDLNIDGDAKKKHAFLDLLLLSNIDGQKLNIEDIKDEVNTFMFEGHDTTTSAIVYCLYCISKEPEVQQKILEELKGIFGNNMNRDPTYDDLKEMKYLGMVLKESLRLYPSVPQFGRIITEDIEINGMKILKGTELLISTFLLHRQPNVYENPLEFKPERFADQRMENPYSWLAFSAGPRNCIGQKFAMIEMKVIISGIVKKFELLPANVKHSLCGNLILRASEGVHVKLLPRKEGA